MGLSRARNGGFVGFGPSVSCALLGQTVTQMSQLFSANADIVVYRIDRKKTGDQPMRLFIACAIIISATIGLGGCFGHHEKAVVMEPLKLG